MSDDKSFSWGTFDQTQPRTKQGERASKRIPIYGGQGSGDLGFPYRTAYGEGWFKNNEEGKPGNCFRPGIGRVILMPKDSVDYLVSQSDYSM